MRRTTFLYFGCAFVTDDLDDDRLVALVGDDDAAALLAAAELGLRLRQARDRLARRRGLALRLRVLVAERARQPLLRGLRRGRLGRSSGRFGGRRPRRRAPRRDGAPRQRLFGWRRAPRRGSSAAGSSAAASSAAGSSAAASSATAPRRRLLGCGLGGRLLGRGLVGGRRPLRTASSAHGAPRLLGDGLLDRRLLDRGSSATTSSTASSAAASSASGSAAASSTAASSAAVSSTGVAAASTGSTVSSAFFLLGFFSSAIYLSTLSVAVRSCCTVRMRAISRRARRSRVLFSSAPVADWKRRLKSSLRVSDEALRRAPRRSARAGP